MPTFDHRFPLITPVAVAYGMAQLAAHLSELGVEDSKTIVKFVFLAGIAATVVSYACAFVCRRLHGSQVMFPHLLLGVIGWCLVGLIAGRGLDVEASLVWTFNPVVYCLLAWVMAYANALLMFQIVYFDPDPKATEDPENSVPTP